MAAAIIFSMLLPFGNAFASTLVKPSSNGCGYNVGHMWSSCSNNLTNGNYSDYNIISYANGDTDTFWYKYNNPIDISSFKVFISAGFESEPYIVEMRNSKGTILYTSSTLKGNTDISVDVKGVTFIGIENKSSGSLRVNEFEVYEGSATPDFNYEELTNLNMNATNNSVSLSWDIPIDNEHFTGTKIYRNGVSLGSVNSVTKAFEDNDVLPGLSYEYKVSAVYSDGTETTGIKKTVTTPKLDSDGDGIPDDEDPYPDDPTNTPPPPLDSDGDGIPDDEDEFPNDPNNKPIIVGEEFEKQPNGDYLVKWSAPTTGTVKIIIAGEEYAAAQASDKQYLIPASDVKYTRFGDPDVSLRPVSENGTIGDSVENPKFLLNIPFTTKDIVEAGNALVWYVAPFLLLALAFLLVPKLRKLVFSSFYKRKEEKIKEQETNRRFAADEKIKQEKTISPFSEKERPLKDRYIPPITSRTPRGGDRAFKMSRVPRGSERDFKTPRTPRTPRESTREPRMPRESFRPFREPRERRRD